MNRILPFLLVLVIASCGEKKRNELVGQYYGDIKGMPPVVLNICEYEEGKLGVELKESPYATLKESPYATRSVFARMTITVEGNDSIVTFEKKGSDTRYDNILKKQRISFMPFDVMPVLYLEGCQGLFNRVHNFPKVREDEYKPMKAAMQVLLE